MSERKGTDPHWKHLQALHTLRLIARRRWRHCVTSLRSAHWLASSLKLATRCPVSVCWLSCSHWDAVTSSIPQGSVLGPLLFLIYINDLGECCDPYCEIYLFADDAKLFKHIVNPDDNYSLQKGIDALQCCSQQWLLKLYISKCNLLVDLLTKVTCIVHLTMIITHTRP